MRKTTIILGALLSTLTLTSAAFAQDEPDTTYDFEDQNVEGGYDSPLGSIVMQPRQGRRVSLIRSRAHFVPELMKSIETI